MVSIGELLKLSSTANPIYFNTFDSGLLLKIEN